MDDSLAPDLYSLDLIGRMNSDPSLEIKRGDSVNGNGDLGYCHFVTGKKEIAGFDKPESWYDSVISKWKKKWGKYARDARDVVENIKETWKAMLYKHEVTEDAYRGSIDHTDLIRRDMMSTPEYSGISLAQVVAADIGLEQGQDDAVNLDRKTNIREMIADYRKKLGEKYDIYRETIQDLLDIGPVPEYAAVRGD